ncbi:hypothetical protein SDC9_28757 [bioreactor metagenome]|uniref:NAD-specific glutamate dehydrogenase n=1 Tax=bioreactor metagenome TaxID=1076179 RepID=A0A644UUP9_9ZZZZ
MARGLRRDADDMHVVVDRVLRRLFRGLEQRPDVDVEADVGKGRGDHLGAAVMPVLTHLHHQHARTAAFLLGEFLDVLLDLLEARVPLVGRAIDAGERLHLGPMPAEHLFHRHRDLSHRGARPRRIHRGFQKVAAFLRTPGDLGQRRLAGRLVPRRAHLRQPRDLRLADLDVVDVENVDRLFLGETILVHADDHLFAAVDHRLAPRRGFLDLQLRHARGHGLGHTAHRLDFLDQLPGLIDELRRQALDVIRARERIDDMGDAGLFLQDQLGVARDPGREFGRQRDRLVKRIGVQRLRAAKRRRHRLIGGAHDVVVGVLFLQAHARGLAVGAQHRRARLLRVELGHHARPEQTRGAQLRDFHKEVHADREEERQTAGEGVDVHATGKRGADIFAAVGDGEGQLLHQVRAGFLHVVARDRDRVELRHLVRGVFDDVRNDPHRGFGRIDIGVADHELLEDIVLDRARELLARHALLLAGDDEVRQHRNDGAVHRHRDRDLLERDAVEQDLHVLDTVDRDARLADIADDARVIAVIAAVGRQVEGDRDALLACGQRLAVEGVTLLGGREARILPDRPGTAGIHRGAHAAGEGREARQGAQMRQLCGVLLGVEGLHLDPFERVPGQAVERPVLELLLGKFRPILFRVRHRTIPSLSTARPGPGGVPSTLQPRRRLAPRLRSSPRAAVSGRPENPALPVPGHGPRAAQPL